MQQFLEFVINHWALWLACVALLGVIAYLELNPSVSGVRLLSTQEATQMINREQAVLVDLRTLDEYKAGHIAQALSLPLESFDKKINKLQKYKSKPIILYCQSGQQATRNGAQLRKAGFERVFALKGGLQSWKSAQLPLVE